MAFKNLLEKVATFATFAPSVLCTLYSMNKISTYNNPHKMTQGPSLFQISDKNRATTLTVPASRNQPLKSAG